MSARRSYSALAALCLSATLLKAETRPVPDFTSEVDLVSVSFTVTDSRGRYVTDLKASDFRVLEDAMEQKIASFSGPEASAESPADQTPVENSIFILFDSSNAMYEQFMHASDTVARFAQNVSPKYAVAVYTFSRNLFRSAPLSRDPLQRVSALRSSVIGDDTAIYNSLLLTVRDAAKVPGNKPIVVLSNGPDTASIVSPDDVARVAQEEGIPVHVVYTRAGDAIADIVFRRVSASTGGRALMAPNWEQQSAAFNSIRDELMNSYTIAYYPAPSENTGFRKLDIEVVTDAGKRYRIRSRPGYKPAPHQLCANCRMASLSEVPAVHGAH